MLLVKSGWAGRSGKVVLDPSAIRRQLKCESNLALGQVLRLRVRYFSDGVAIGSKSFVEGVFRENRKKFGSKRKDGARVIREAPEAGLFSLRGLRGKAVE